MSKQFAIEDHPALAALIQEIEPGSSAALTKDGKTVANVSRTIVHDPVAATAAMERIIARSKTASLGGLKIKDLLHEGHKY